MILYDDNGVPFESTCACRQGRPVCGLSAYCSCATEGRYTAHKNAGSIPASPVGDFKSAQCKKHPLPPFGQPVAGTYCWPSTTHFRQTPFPTDPRYTLAQLTVTGSGGYGATKIPANIVINGQSQPFPPATSPIAQRLARLGFRYGSTQFTDAYRRHAEEDVPDDKR